MDPKQPLEIDHGDDALKRGWEGEIARQARQAKIVREMEWDLAVRRARIIRWTVKVPLLLIFLSGVTVLGLDYAKAIDLGIFPRHIAEPVVVPSVLADSQEAIAARNIPSEGIGSQPIVSAVAQVPAVVGSDRPAPIAQPVASPELAPVVERPVEDPAVIDKAKRKVERAHAGVLALTKTIQERQQQITSADLALYGSIAPNGTRNHDGLDWQIHDLSADEARYEAECGPRPNPQEIQIMSTTNTNISNLVTQQGNIQRQMAHDQEVLASTQARLQKAQAEESAASAALKNLQP